MMLDGAFCDSQFYMKTQWSDILAPSLSTSTFRLLRQLTDSGKFDDPRYVAIENSLSMQVSFNSFDVVDTQTLFVKKKRV